MDHQDRIESLTKFREDGKQFRDSVEAEYTDTIVSLVGKLKNKRKEMGLSQQDIADATGMRAPNITRIETYKSRPSLEIIMRYAAALGYDVDLRLKPRSGKNDGGSSETDS